MRPFSLGDLGGECPDFLAEFTDRHLDAEIVFGAS